MRVLVVMLAAGIAAGAADGKSLREAGGPAELPPPGYAGTRYVDSEGCVFLRAGYGGQVQWVPQVTRDGRFICGLRPSAVKGTAPSAARSAPVSRNPSMPPGYRPAWEDDRLNPYRGPRDPG